MARQRNKASRPSTVSLSSDQTTDSASQLPCDVFNTTYSLHRASPLYIGASPLSEKRLAVISQRLRDLLVGDIVRGVEVGLEPGGGVMGSAGGLEAVLVEWVPTDVVLGVEQGQPAQQALQVTLQYGNATCEALLLPSGREGAEMREDGILDEPRTAADRTERTQKARAEMAEKAKKVDSSFLHLPLVLLRMPAPLKAAVVGFLSSTFDCRISALRLTSADLVQQWEAWARTTALPTSGPLAKDAVLTLGFHLPDRGAAADTPQVDHTRETEDETPAAAAAATTAPSLGIKSIDVIVPYTDLPRFLRAGRTLGGDGQPFMRALSAYIKQHLALDLSNAAVRVVRIACGGFVLAESRIKVFSAPDVNHQMASQQLMRALTIRAQGGKPASSAGAG